MNLRKQKQGAWGQLLSVGVVRLQISIALEQKTADFNVAIGSRLVQWSELPEERQKNQIAQT